jgi:hypothetical protein
MSRVSGRSSRRLSSDCGPSQRGCVRLLRTVSFHKLLNERGQLVDAELARRGHPPILKIKGVLTTGQPQKLAAVNAGLITPVRAMHLDMLLSELVTDVEEQTDVLLIGMNDGDGYSRLSIFNPIHCRNKAQSMMACIPAEVWRK